MITNAVTIFQDERSSGRFRLVSEDVELQQGERREFCLQIPAHGNVERIVLPSDVMPSLLILSCRVDQDLFRIQLLNVHDGFVVPESRIPFVRSRKRRVLKKHEARDAREEWIARRRFEGRHDRWTHQRPLVFRIGVVGTIPNEETSRRALEDLVALIRQAGVN
jgi:hypothetical protein